MFTNKRISTAIVIHLTIALVHGNYFENFNTLDRVINLFNKTIAKHATDIEEKLDFGNNLLESNPNDENVFKAEFGVKNIQSSNGLPKVEFRGNNVQDDGRLDNVSKDSKVKSSAKNLKDIGPSKVKFGGTDSKGNSRFDVTGDVQMNNITNSETDLSRNIANIEEVPMEKGRKKSNMGGMMMMAGVMSAGTLLAFSLMGISAMAGKALVTSIIALTLALLSSIKGHDKGTTYEVHAKPIYSQEHSHSSEIQHLHSGYK
ncbi:hypothetical protein M8J75_007682 [Diaphorina citri]|nr:hypothetical protein M8J75_007682 [Diaphorina citri]